MKRTCDIKPVNVPSSFFTNEKVEKGMLAETEQWKSFAEAVRSLLATPYVAVLFFAGETNRPVGGIFPRTVRAMRLAELMGQATIVPPCREIARGVPGLLSICGPVRACSCPLRAFCGADRVDAIRLESHKVLLGDLLLFAGTELPISREASERVKAIVQTLSDVFLGMLNQDENEGSKP